MPDRRFVATSRGICCGDCETTSIQLPEWSHDDVEIFCPDCGGSLGTIGQLRDILLAALAGDPDALSDNDN